jgi:hypothetical protein
MGFVNSIKLFFLVALLVTSHGYATKTPQTYVTLNSQMGCSVHVGAWLSPSCTHCSEYFNSILPKLASKPGFCIDYHSLPHMYLMDMPVSVLIWSQGPDNAIRNAQLFYGKQNEWLAPSVDKADINDNRRKEDLDNFLTNPNLDNKSKEKIQHYLSPTDPALYVKIFALKNGFPIEHLMRFLPNGAADEAISRSLLQDLPRTESPNGERAVVKYSPAFTFVNNGALIPDDQLDGKILTESSADEMLKKAGPPVPLPVKKIEEPIKKHTAKRRPRDETESNNWAPAKRVLAKQNVIEDDDEEIQEADDEEIDPLAEEATEEDDDVTTIMSERLQAVLEAQTKGMG